MLFDSHAHIDDAKFDDDRAQVLSGLRRSGVGLMINAASDIRSSLESMRLAETYDNVYFAAGIHPQEADKASERDFAELERILEHPKCVAIGEIGLDYHYDEPAREVQRAVFYRQLKLSAAKSMPVVIHDRDAHAECLQAVKDTGARGVFHCFSGSAQTAAELVDLGFYISFSGVITFKNAKRAVEAAKAVPMDRILIETDSPYLAPEPFRGRRNEPKYVEYVARKLAEVKGVSFEDISSETFSNALRLFGIDLASL